MERNEWSFSGSSTEREPLHPTLAVFRTVAECNDANSRRNVLCARYFNTRDDAVDVWEDGAHHVGPSGDESLPAEGLEAPLHISPAPCQALTIAYPFSP